MAPCQYQTLALLTLLGIVCLSSPLPAAAAPLPAAAAQSCSERKSCTVCLPVGEEECLWSHSTETCSSNLISVNGGPRVTNFKHCPGVPKCTSERIKTCETCLSWGRGRSCQWHSQKGCQYRDNKTTEDGATIFNLSSQCAKQALTNTINAWKDKRQAQKQLKVEKEREAHENERESVRKSRERCADGKVSFLSSKGKWGIREIEYKDLKQLVVMNMQCSEAIMCYLGEDLYRYWKRTLDESKVFVDPSHGLPYTNDSLGELLKMSGHKERPKTKSNNWELVKMTNTELATKQRAGMEDNKFFFDVWTITYDHFKVTKRLSTGEAPFGVFPLMKWGIPVKIVEHKSNPASESAFETKDETKLVEKITQMILALLSLGRLFRDDRNPAGSLNYSIINRDKDFWLLKLLQLKTKLWLIHDDLADGLIDQLNYPMDCERERIRERERILELAHLAREEREARDRNIVEQLTEDIESDYLTIHR